MHHRLRFLESAGFIMALALLCSSVMALTLTTSCLAGTRWTVDGVRLSDSDCYLLSIAPDGAGGALVAWSNYAVERIFAQKISASGAPQWGAQGIVVCDSSLGGYRDWPKVVSDGAGGAVVVWNDSRPWPNGPFAIAQKISASGELRWPTEGIIVISSNNPVGSNPEITTDGAGGAIVSGVVNNGSDTDVVVNRVSDPGTVHWGSGVVVGGAGVSGDQKKQVINPDGQGGAFIAFEDTRGATTDIYANHVNSGGSPRWGTPPGHGDGVPVCNAAGHQIQVQVVPDTSNGALISWVDGRRGSPHEDLYANRLDQSGAARWNGTNGAALCDSGSVNFPRMVADGSGGAIATWQTGPLGNYDIYANRVGPSGVPQWNGTGGAAVCSAAGDNRWPDIAADGAGGAVIAWQNTTPGTSVHAQRVDVSGSNRWTTAGVQVCGTYHAKGEPRMAPDGTGGGIIAWWDERTGSGVRYPYAQRISNDPPVIT